MEGGGGGVERVVFFGERGWDGDQTSNTHSFLGGWVGEGVHVRVRMCVSV